MDQGSPHFLSHLEADDTWATRQLPSHHAGTPAKPTSLEKPFQANSWDMGASLAQGHEKWHTPGPSGLLSIIRPITANSARCHLRWSQSCSLCVHRGPMLHHSVEPGLKMVTQEHKTSRSRLGESKIDNYPSNGTRSLFRDGFEEIVASWKFHLKMRKNFFPLRVTEPWPRLPREAVESPSLEIFQTRLDAVLRSLLWVTLLGQGVGLGDPQRSLPSPAMLWFRASEGRSKPRAPHKQERREVLSPLRPRRGQDRRRAKAGWLLWKLG